MEAIVMQQKMQKRDVLVVVEAAAEDDDEDFQTLHDAQHLLLNIHIHGMLPSQLQETRVVKLQRSLNDVLHFEQEMEGDSVGLKAHCERIFIQQQMLHRPSSSAIVQRIVCGVEWFLQHALNQRETTDIHRFLGIYHPNVSKETFDQALKASSVTSQVFEFTIASGCSEEQTVVQPKDTTEPQVFVWKFASHGAGVRFTAHFMRHESIEKGEWQDPYSICEHDHEPVEQQEEAVAVYPAMYAFEGNECVYGHCALPKEAMGVRFQWENADWTTIVSKNVAFQVQMMPLATFEAMFHSLNALHDGFLHDFIMKNGHPVNLDDDADIGETQDDPTVLPDTLDQCVEKEQDDNKNQALRQQLAVMEQELVATKRALKETRDQLDVATHVQKMQLETIAQLQLRPSPANEEKRQEHEEKQRLMELCAQFQEQCLWRSIETSDSEKRNLMLEATVHSLEQSNTQLQSQVDVLTTQLTECHAKNQRLRAEKTVLIQEIKRREPYACLNLLYEAQEARMMQKRLQTQLDELTKQ